MKEDIVTLDELALSLVQGGLTDAEIAELQRQANKLINKDAGEMGMTCGEVFKESHCSPTCLTGPGSGGDILRRLGGLPGEK